MYLNIAIFWIFVILIYVCLLILIIILEGKRPEKTIGWLLIMAILPPVGIILYVFLGRNWKVNKLNKKLSPKIKDLITKTMYKINNLNYISLVNLVSNTSDSPLFINNDVTIFRDGIEKFNCLKKQILKAKHHIHLEYYIVKNDDIGNEIKNLLIQKSKEGVKIRFIIDRVGSITIGKKFIYDMKKHDIDVVQYSYFLAPILRIINTQINYRNHRKLVIIDGNIGFIGGINIGDEYLGKGKLGYWRDTHIMVQGNFVLGLQAVFIDDFFNIKKANKSKEYNFLSLNREFDKYFPKLNSRGNTVMQFMKSGPDSHYSSIMQSTLKMISMAKHHIYITTPYFVPPESIIESLKVASLSGIDVRILFPGCYDHFTVYYASRTYLNEVIKCGAKVYFYDKNSFIHAKVMTIDGEISSIGTANMDIRSYELNYEINSIMYDKKITEQLETMFFNDLTISTLITEKQCNDTSLFIKFIETITRLFSSLL